MARERGRRAQVVLSTHEYDLLESYAAETKQSVSGVIRQAIHHVVFIDLEKRRKEEALQWLAAGNDPVKDWPEMEREIESMWEEPLDGQCQPLH